MAMYKAYNREQAMCLAKAVAQSGDFERNEKMEENWEMPVYLAGDGSYIVDASKMLNPMLHLVIRDGLDVVRELDVEIEDTGEIEDYAEMQSQMFSVRTYRNGCSHDDWMLNGNGIDGFFVQKVIEGAISAYRNGYVTKRQAANVAEFQATRYFRNHTMEINCYDSVYLPIKYAPFEAPLGDD